MRDRGSEAVRVVVAVVAVLALCVVVGMASSARRTSDDAAAVPFDGRAAATLIGAVMYLVLAVLLAMAARIVFGLLRSKDDDAEDEDEQVSALDVTTPLWLQRLIIVGIVALIALCAWVTWLIISSFLTTPAPPDAAGREPVDPRPVVSPIGGDGILPDIAIYFLIGLVLALVVLTVLVALRRPGGDDEAVVEVELPQEPVALVGDPFSLDLDALGREAPRAAVIIAFAMAQRMLAAAGAPARWDETSAEHVQRVGPTLPGAAPPALDHLLGLYHVAKFSAHPITDQHRRDAVAAVVQLRDSLLPLAATVAVTGSPQTAPGGGPP